MSEFCFGRDRILPFQVLVIQANVVKVGKENPTETGKNRDFAEWIL
jgi:hypothetical protein